MNISLDTYLQDPCRVSSLPYWKAVNVVIPEDMKILHDTELSSTRLEKYKDEAYFRLKHDLTNLSPAVLPEDFSLCQISPAAYAAHINGCYANTALTGHEIKNLTLHPTYQRDLWLAVQHDPSRQIAATGIGELDIQLGEGTLEWIQVSPQYRGLGLGTYVVCELLSRISAHARFATVSGQVNNPFHPEFLYRKCGFTGDDVWHILRTRGGSPASTR